jgi:hypothetical protein
VIVDITTARWVAGRARCRTTAVFAIASFGLGLAAVQTSVLGADFGTSYSAPMQRDAPVAPETRSAQASRTNSLCFPGQDDRTTRIIDQIYREAMRASACYKPDSASEARYSCNAAVRTGR